MSSISQHFEVKWLSIGTRRVGLGDRMIWATDTTCVYMYGDNTPDKARCGMIN